MCVNGSILLGEKLFLNVPLSKAHTAQKQEAGIWAPGLSLYTQVQVRVVEGSFVNQLINQLITSCGVEEFG